MKNWTFILFSTLNIALYFIVVALWITIPESTLLNGAITIFSLLLSAGLVLMFKEKFSTFYRSTYFKGLTQGLVSAFLIFCILGVINFLSYKNPFFIDTTARGHNSLSSQTVGVLKEMKEDLSIQVFARKEMFGKIRGYLEQYRMIKTNINVEYVDITLRPDMVKKFSIVKDPTLIFKLGEKSLRVLEISELEIVNTLVNLERKERPIIGYVHDHGTLDLAMKEKEGGSFLRKIIQDSSYEIQEFKLKQTTKIPKEYKSVVILGPKGAFFKEELKVLDRYLANGGTLLVAIDPDFQNDNISDFRNWLKEYGIEAHNNMVMDRLKYVTGSNGSVPIVHQFNAKHPITEKLKDAIFFPLTSSISSYGESDFAKNFEPLGLSQSYPAAWADFGLDEFINGNVVFNEDKDIKGPVTYFGATQVNDTKIVVFGNSSFVSNNYAKFTKNFSLLANCLKWLSGEKNLISFNNPVVKDEPVFLSRHEVGIMFYFSVLFAPLILFGAAFFVYRRRQKL
tara:strand:+ start:97332 stop:98858 length:1527 start_codon:yes stop_codon:yes gene_type:complete